MPNILIAEDERPIADLIRMTLKGAGYRCDWAPDGDRAADLAGAGTYDLALVDVMLPGSDGFALLEYCQTLDLPVIFVTARGAVADRVRGLHAGAEDYIVKPFDAAELLARVETVLRRFHKTEALITLAGVTAAALWLARAGWIPPDGVAVVWTGLGAALLVGGVLYFVARWVYFNGQNIWWLGLCVALLAAKEQQNG